MPEVGALALRIQAVGGDTLLESLRRIDAAAQSLDKKPIAKQATAAIADLNKEINAGIREFQLMARTVDVGSAQMVGDLKKAAAAQLEYMQSVGATTEQQLRMVQAVQAFDRRIATSLPQATGAAQTFALGISKATGGLTTFGTKGFSALNAVAFGVSQLASTGEVSFRSLATSLGGFLAFLGPEGAIASIAVTTGLALADFFSRTQRGIEETAAKAQKALKELQTSVEEQRRSGDAGGLIARAQKADADLTDTREELATTTARILALEAEVEVHRQKQGVVPGEGALARAGAAELESLRARKAELLQIIPLLEREAALSLEAARNVRSQTTGPRGLPIRVTASGGGRRELPDVNLLPRANASEEVVGQALTGASFAKADPQVREQISLRLSEIHALFSHGLSEEAKRLEEEAQSIGVSIASGMIGGFAAALAGGDLANAFKDATASFLQGLGNFAVTTALESIKIAAAVLKLKALIVAHPLAAIAVGVGLLALGRALGGRGQGAGTAGGFGGGTFGGAASGSSDAIRQLVTDPNAAIRDRVARVPAAVPAGAANPFAGFTFITTESAAGQRVIGTAVQRFTEKGGRR